MAKAEPVKLRLSGDSLCIKAIISLLEDSLRVKNISREYPNRNEDGVRVYLEIHPQK